MIPADALPVAVDLARPLTLRELGRLEDAGVPLQALRGSRADLIAALAWLALLAAGVPATLDETRDLTLDDIELLTVEAPPDPTQARPGE